MPSEKRRLKLPEEEFAELKKPVKDLDRPCCRMSPKEEVYETCSGSAAGRLPADSQ
jgi:hypothetical protein